MKIDMTKPEAEYVFTRLPSLWDKEYNDDIKKLKLKLLSVMNGSGE